MVCCRYENGDTSCGTNPAVLHASVPRHAVLAGALVFFLWVRLFKFFAASPWLGLFQVTCDQTFAAAACNMHFRVSLPMQPLRSWLWLLLSCCSLSRLLTGC
jgi:hypothetical protein